MNTLSAATNVGVQGIRSTVRIRRSQRFKNLPRMFGRHEFSTYWVFRGANIEVGSGEVLIVLGNDPLMCTTLMRCMCGLLPADEGTIEGDARSILVSPPTGKALRLLSLRQSILMMAGLYGMTDRQAAERFDAIASTAGVQDSLPLTINDAPPSMKLQIALSVALHAPVDLLAFDGTARGGDPDFAKHTIARLTAARDKGQALLIRTENVALINALGSKAIILGEEVSRTASIAEAIDYLKGGKNAEPEPVRQNTDDEDDEEDVVGI